MHLRHTFKNLELEVPDHVCCKETLQEYCCASSLTQVGQFLVPERLTETRRWIFLGFWQGDLAGNLAGILRDFFRPPKIGLTFVGRNYIYIYMGQTKWDKRVSAKSCGFLGKSAVFCEYLRLRNAAIPWARKSDNLQKLAKICELGSVCPFSFVPFSSS